MFSLGVVSDRNKPHVRRLAHAFVSNHDRTSQPRWHLPPPIRANCEPGAGLARKGRNRRLQQAMAFRRSRIATATQARWNGLQTLPCQRLLFPRPCRGLRLALWPASRHPAFAPVRSDCLPSLIARRRCTSSGLPRPETRSPVECRRDSREIRRGWIPDVVPGKLGPSGFINSSLHRRNDLVTSALKPELANHLVD